MLSISSTPCAADFISLADREKKLLDKGEIIVREIDTKGKRGRTVEVIGIINASRSSVLRVLEEYDKYPEFMPNVSKIDLIGQAGNESILNYTLTLPLGKIKKYRVKTAVTEPESQSSVIHWQLQEWPELLTEETIRDTTGYWRIEDRTKKSSLVVYHVYVDPGPTPFGLGWLVDLLSKNNVPKAFLRIKSRTEALAPSKIHAP